MARRGEPRPARSDATEYNALVNLIVNFPDFRETLYAIRPDWFTEGRVQLAMERFRQMARDGLPRPAANSPDATYLTNLMAHQPGFRELLIAIRPDWFPSEIAAEQKRRLLQMANDGLPRPPSKSKDGHVLINLLMRHPDFKAEITAARPDWWTVDSQRAEIAEFKSRMLELDERPDEKTCNRIMRYTAHASNCFDEDFRDRMEEKPWFKNKRSPALLERARQKSLAAQQANCDHLVRMTERPDPTTTDYKKWKRLAKVAPELDARVREAHPDWYTPDKKKRREMV